MDQLAHIQSLLPYRRPFLFVDAYTYLSDDTSEGHYRFREDESFYEGHFPDRPITPGVILIEVMAQIGLVGMGMWLLKAYEMETAPSFVFTSSEVDFLLPVYPGEKVSVKAEKVYFRLGKLKCKVEMWNEANEKICQGQLSGMLIKDQHDRK